MYTEVERRQRAEIIGAKLVQIRSQVLRGLEIVYSLRPEEAEDIYSETCIYLLDRGVDKLENLNCGGAIRRIANMRAINYVQRYRNRMSHHTADDWDQWGLIQDDHDPNGWIENHDIGLILNSYIDQAKTDDERTIAQNIHKYESVTELARACNIIPNTAQSIFRRIKIYARQYEQRP
jgi:DNA-directed RNA polymerase specialized sigma24 family protein